MAKLKQLHGVSFVPDTVQKAKDWIEIAPDSANKCLIIMLDDRTQQYNISYFIGGMDTQDMICALTYMQKLVLDEIKLSDH